MDAGVAVGLGLALGFVTMSSVTMYVISISCCLSAKAGADMLQKSKKTQNSMLNCLCLMVLLCVIMTSCYSVLDVCPGAFSCRTAPRLKGTLRVFAVSVLPVRPVRMTIPALRWGIFFAAVIVVKARSFLHHPLKRSVLLVCKVYSHHLLPVVGYL